MTFEGELEEEAGRGLVRECGQGLGTRSEEVKGWKGDWEGIAEELVMEE